MITSTLSNPLFIILLSIVILLLIVIMAFASVVKSAAHLRKEQEKARKGAFVTGIKMLIVIGMIGGLSNSLFAQTNATPMVAERVSYWGLDGFVFYLMLTIIMFEFFVAWVLYKIAMQLLGVEERKRKLAEDRAKANIKQPTLIEKLNASVAIEEEADIMLDHNYDGIRELDNNLPPWWKYGFYLTIVFAFVYLFYFHAGGGGKLQLSEYDDQLAQAKQEVEEYRKKAANLVDENNVIALVDNESLSSGKTIYLDNCAACHGRAGEGGVGPNMADDYWLHKGGIRDIFKTIKYGFPEKGMKAWQQDLGAKQINEVASYIKSLRGTNPPNPKEKQGELYKEENASDTTKVVVTDSVQTGIKEIKNEQGHSNK